MLPFRLTTPGGPSMRMGSAISFRCALFTFSINALLSQAAPSREAPLVAERAGVRDYDIVI